MTDNIITAVFGPSRIVKTAPVWRIDKGMKLNLVGLDLPDYYQVHFANTPVQGEAKPVLASSNIVDIPDEYFQTGNDIYAWVYLTPAEGVAYTVRMVTIPVKARPDISGDEPTPAEESIIDQAIVALNENVGIAETSAQTAQEAADRAETVASNIESVTERAEAAAEAAEEAADHIDGYTARAEAAAVSAQSNAQSASASASSASTDATTASQAASQAASSASSASQSASAASGSATSASTSASGASASASAAQTARSAAESAADRAETAVSQLVDISATAQTLAPGSAATASYDNGVITLGIPRGEKGETGETGATGPAGPAGSQGPAGVGVPAGGRATQILSKRTNTDYDTQWIEVGGWVPGGGMAGQVLAKKTGLSYDTEWVDMEGGGGTSDYTDLTNKPSINGVTLTGNKSLSDLGAASESDVAAKYTKPSAGIPASDLASAVQTSLGKADTALQSAPVTSVNGQTGAVVLSIPSTAADVGAIAAPASPATGAFLVWSGSAWTAQTLATWQGGSY